MAVRQRISVFGFLAAVALAVAEPARAQTLTSIVVEYPSGQVLSESGADVVNYPASLTKMMTLYLTFEALKNGRIDMATRLPVSKEAARQPPSKLGLRPGSTIRVDDAIRALAVKSANDVAVVIAEGLGGTEARFAQLMTYRARELGMTRTRFVNASGLPDEAQRTTARDMAILATRLLSDFPEYYGFFGLAHFVWRGRTYHNHNVLLNTYRGMDGLKTGYIRASGYNLAASAVRNGRRLVAVVLGGATSGARNREMVRLLDEAFGTGPAAESVTAAVGPSTGANSAGTSAARKPARISGSLEQPQANAKAAVRKGGNFSVQLGAFPSRRVAAETARRAARTVPSLREGKVSVVPVGSRTRVYAARVEGLNRAAAQGSCESLKRAGKPCFVVAPPERAVGSR
jgi:D-alanyl-D-alanine carboxypeptidase